MSDPFFPESRRKSLWQRLTQILSLDGGGDWTIESLATGAYWTCPAGVYEVFVLLINGANNVILYQPASNIASATLFVCPAASGIVFPWAPFHYVQVYDAGAIVDEYACTFHKGWILTSGWRLRHVGFTWQVRYRRIG